MDRAEFSSVKLDETGYDGKFRKRVEQLFFRKPYKEPTYVLPKPVEPIFKKKSVKFADEEAAEAVEQTFVTATEDEMEYGEDYGEYGPYEDNEIEFMDNMEYEIQEESLPEADLPSPLRLAQLCLKVIAENFSQMFRCVKVLPEENLKVLYEYLDFSKTDVGLAARIIDDESYWKRGTYLTWPTYHRPWAHTKTWKIYFLEKWLARAISNLDQEGYGIEEINCLAKRTNDWIYCLDIEGLKAPKWPAAVDVDSSSDSGAALSDHGTIDSDMTLNGYLNRRINYFPMPTLMTRYPLKSIVEQLSHLTHLNFSFGYDNFSMKKDVKFAKINDDDVLNFAQALAVCKTLYCFKLTRSKLTPEQLETILLGLYSLTSFKEIELSNLFLTDKHMKAVTNLLKFKRSMRLMSLKYNSIGPSGLARLLHTVVLRDCKLKVLDVSMNPLQDPGGGVMASLLTKKKQFLKRVYMCGTGLTHISGYNLGVVLYFNKCLKVLDLSVNQFNDFGAEALLKGVEHNYTLERLELRECGIPFQTVREIESICFRNKQLAWQKSYVYPEAHPRDFWSGFKELDAEAPIGLKMDGTEEKEEEKGEGEDEAVSQEILEIFVWACALMKPRSKFLLVKDIHALMKKSVFTSGFDVIVDTLILTKQKEIILKGKMDMKREKDDRSASSSVVYDFPTQEVLRRNDERIKADLTELEALQVLKDVNRCGRIDVLLKSLSPEKIEETLKNIGKALFNDSELPTSIGMRLPFAKKWYRGFPDPEPADEVEETYGEVDGEMRGEYSFVGEEEFEMKSGTKDAPQELVKVETNDFGSRIAKRSPSPGQTVTTTSTRSMSTAVNAMPSFTHDEQFLAIRDQVLGVRSQFKKWPKDGPPKFPTVIPFEIVKDCHFDLAGTESENEDDLPYWTDQWLQKF